MKQHAFEATLTEFRDFGRLFCSKITWECTNGSYYYWTDSLGVIIRPEPRTIRILESSRWPCWPCKQRMPSYVHYQHKYFRI